MPPPLWNIFFHLPQVFSPPPPTGATSIVCTQLYKLHHLSLTPRIKAEDELSAASKHHFNSIFPGSDDLPWRLGLIHAIKCIASIDSSKQMIHLARRSTPSASESGFLVPMVSSPCLAIQLAIIAGALKINRIISLWECYVIYLLVLS